MSTRLRITKTGKGIQNAIESLDDPSELLNEVGEALALSTIQRIMTTKTAPSGQAWAPWATSTLLARNKKGNAAQGLLYDTGALGNSITWQVKGKTVEVGSSLGVIGEYLQNGTANMPARPFIGLSKEDLTEAQRITKEYFKRKFNK